MASSPLVSIVDDDPSVRRALQRLCASAGYRVEVYESGEAFLDAEALESTDCLILDVHLPGRSGLQLQSELIAGGYRTPTVFITAYDDEPGRARAIQNGALAFLGKPLDADRLLEVIDQAVSGGEADCG